MSQATDYYRSQQLSDWQNRTQENTWSPMFNPANPFGSSYFNPAAGLGQDWFNITPEMQRNFGVEQAGFANDIIGAGLAGMNWLNPNLRSVNIAGQGPLAWMTGGNLHLAPNTLSGALGGSSGLNLDSGARPEWSYEAPGGWGGYEFDINTIDPTAAAAAWEPWGQEQREKGFAEAAHRGGPAMTGMVAKTPYQEALGGVARRSAEDLARIGADYSFRSATENARNQLNRQLAEQQASFGEWQNQANMAHAAELARNMFGLDLYGQDINKAIAESQLGQNEKMMMMQIMQQFMGGF